MSNGSEHMTPSPNNDPEAPDLDEEKDALLDQPVGSVPDPYEGWDGDQDPEAGEDK
jgi:hypothetical protein